MIHEKSCVQQIQNPRCTQRLRTIGLTKDKNLFYFHGDVNMGNVVGYINSSINCKNRENAEYGLLDYPIIPPWRNFKHDLVGSKEYGHIAIHATKDINIREEF